MSALTGEDYTISIRTFQRDLDAICELFLIDIPYSRIEGLYYIDDAFSDEIQSERLMESLEVFHSLKMRSNLGDIFHFETRPLLRTEHLSRMIFAIKNKRIITLTYNKNWENQYTERIVLPLLLKEFRGRWYVKGAVLHHSQKVIEDTAEAFVVKLYLSIITFDFIMEILGYGELVEVLPPAELRTQVSERLKKAAEKYK